MSIFSDDWRDCLREQYKYVTQNNDSLTENSLTDMLHQVGFGDDELRELKIRATMRVEDISDDFKPDLNLMKQPTEVNHEFQPHPAECQCPSCVNINLTPHDEEGQPIEVEPEELAERQAFAADNEDGDEPEQLSLF